MDRDKLTNFYDDLKSKLDQDENRSPAQTAVVRGMGRGGMAENPAAVAWRHKASNECERLKDDCAKHMILDIYCKILPLDDDYKCGHHGKMKQDIDDMLFSKGMSATQYLKSCYNETKAPLLEFVMRSVDGIGRQFMEEANEKLKDAQENDIPIPEPKADTPEDKEIADQLVDVKEDNEYESFIEKLKKKTVDKIVTDVSKIISAKKEEKDMTFDPKPIVDEQATTESVISVGLDYAHSKLMTENTAILESVEEDLIGMAIREATLNQIDTVFRQPDSDYRHFSTRIRMGKGYVLNESAISYLSENVKSEED